MPRQGVPLIADDDPIEKVSGRSYAEEMRRRVLGPLKLRDTVVPGDRTHLPGPHAQAYYRYEDGGRQKVADISRQNLSLLAGAGDMISTTRDTAAPRTATGR